MDAAHWCTVLFIVTVVQHWIMLESWIWLPMCLVRLHALRMPYIYINKYYCYSFHTINVHVHLCRHMSSCVESAGRLTTWKMASGWFADDICDFLSVCLPACLSVCLCISSIGTGFLMYAVTSLSLSDRQSRQYVMYCVYVAHFVHRYCWSLVCLYAEPKFAFN
jgi:hypothetical protein